MTLLLPTLALLVGAAALVVIAFARLRSTLDDIDAMASKADL